MIVPSSSTFASILVVTPISMLVAAILSLLSSDPIQTLLSTGMVVLVATARDTRPRARWRSSWRHDTFTGFPRSLVA